MTIDQGIAIDSPSADDSGVPAYLRDIYTWAYLTPLAVAIFDHQPIVSMILWGNFHRLLRGVLAEVPQGGSALQLASVYGPFSLRLLEALGPRGSLDVVDVAPVQVERCRALLGGYSNCRVLSGDAADPPGNASYDVVISFFLLHEVPEDYKERIVMAALARVRPGGRAVFVDYHEPVRWHPLRPIMTKVFDWLEPYAKGLWSREVADYAGQRAEEFSWRKVTCFGGLYQQVVAERRV
ncbi:MAG: rhodoquinone biosynthesis methyltransferase RquA [Rhodospirillaceae bacterium]